MANVVVRGCVNWGTGNIEFSTLRGRGGCSYCELTYTGCTIFDGGVHDGQVRVEVTSCGCSDTYYACVNWGTGDFELTIPGGCVDFGAEASLDVTFNSLVDCTTCYDWGGGLGSYKHVGVDTDLNGSTFTLPVDGGNNCLWDVDDTGGNYGSIRWYGSSNSCAGGYVDTPHTGITIRIAASGGGVRLYAYLHGGYYVFDETVSDCCWQTIDNGLTCGADEAATDGGTAEITETP